MDKIESLLWTKWNLIYIDIEHCVVKTKLN